MIKAVLSGALIFMSFAIPPKYPRIGVACIVQKEGKILLGERIGSHGKGSFAPPGGHLEFGESLEACAKRELLEETGLKALSLHLGPFVENIMENGSKHYITFFFFVDDFEGELKLLEPDKCLGWNWFEKNHLPSPLFPSVVSFIEKNQNKY